MEKNKTRKYFKYAIGEIILVVIGILIALQINNWNTINANEKEAYNQLLDVQNEILNNIQSFDLYGNAYNEKLNDVRRVFSDTLVFEDYQKEPRLFQIMGNYYSFESQYEAFDKLIQNADNLPKKYKPIILDLKKHYNMSAFDVIYKGIIDESDNHNIFMQNFAESNYRFQYDGLIEFVMTNKDYKNRLAIFSFTLDDLVPELTYKKYEAIHLYKQMVALGFPNKDSSQLDNMYVPINEETVRPFIGTYTNTNITTRIRYNNSSFEYFINEDELPYKLFIRDSSTLVNGAGRYLEFNADKTKYTVKLNRRNPHFTRIAEDD